MISEKDSFCATVNGIYKVLNNFYEARKPATKPTDPDAMQIDSDCSESELNHHLILMIRITTVEKCQKMANQKPGITGKDDTVHGPLKAIYSKKQVFDFDIEFVEFMKKEISNVKKKMERSMKTVLQCKTVGQPIPGGDSLANFKAIFAEELLKCTALTTHRSVGKGKRQVANNTKNLNAAIGGPKSGSTSTPTAKQCKMKSPISTSSSAVTKPASQLGDTKTSPAGTKATNQPEIPKSSPLGTCKTGKKC